MSNKPLQLGITGGIGAGKSTVSRIFSTLGVPIYNADKRARWLMENDEKLMEELRSVFGDQVFTSEGINRDFLADIVFKSEPMLNQLNAIVHPVVGVDYSSWLRQNNTFSYSIKEAALLIESGSYKLIDVLIHVWSPQDLRVKRIMERDPFRSEQEIHKIIGSQLSDDQRDEVSDYRIINDENEPVIPQVLALHEKFK